MLGIVMNRRSTIAENRAARDKNSQTRKAQKAAERSRRAVEEDSSSSSKNNTGADGSAVAYNNSFRSSPWGSFARFHLNRSTSRSMRGPELTEMARTACLHETLNDHEDPSEITDHRSKMKANNTLRTAITQFSSLSQKINGLFDADDVIRTHTSTSAILWSKCAKNKPVEFLMHTDTEDQLDPISDDMADEAELPAGSWKIHPSNDRKVAWDILIGLLIVYSTLMVPYRIGFGVESSFASNISDWIMDSCFLLDMILSFMTAYTNHDGELVVDSSLIAKHYLASSFWIDFFSTVPWDKIPFPIENESMLRMSKLLRVLRMARLLKIVRLFKMGSALNGDGDGLVNPSLVSLARMLVCLVFIGHLLACGWHAIFQYNRPYSNGGPPNWVAQSGLFSTSPAAGFADDDGTSINYDSDGNPRYVDLSLRYANAIYWAFTTMTTVGYGDINTSNTSERLFAIFAMLVGATVFGYVIGNVTVMMENIDMKSALFREKMDRVKEYLRDRKFPGIMSKRLRRHFKYYYTHASVFDPQEYLSTLPQAALCHVFYRQYFGLISQCSFFKDNPPVFVTQVVDKCRPFFLEAGEFVFFEGEIGTHLFLLNRGVLKLLTCNVCTKKHMWFTQVGADSVLGEGAVLRYGYHKYSAVSVRHSEFHSLAKEELQFVLDAFPAVREWLDHAEGPANFLATLCKFDTEGQFAAEGKAVQDVMFHPAAQGHDALEKFEAEKIKARLASVHEGDEEAKEAGEKLAEDVEGGSLGAKCGVTESDGLLGDLPTDTPGVELRSMTSSPKTKYGGASDDATFAEDSSVMGSPPVDVFRKLTKPTAGRLPPVSPVRGPSHSPGPKSLRSPPSSPARWKQFDSDAAEPPDIRDAIGPAAAATAAAGGGAGDSGAMSPPRNFVFHRTPGESVVLSARKGHAAVLGGGTGHTAVLGAGVEDDHPPSKEAKDSFLESGVPVCPPPSVGTSPSGDEFRPLADEKPKRHRPHDSFHTSHPNVASLINGAELSEPGEEGHAIQMQLWKERKIVHPELYWKMVFDVFVCLLIIYSVITVTYYIGFSQTISDPDKFDAPTVGFDNYFVNPVFFLDMVVTCRTAYFDEDDESVLVTESGRIMRRYLHTWFALDFLSTFPFFLLVGLPGAGSLSLFKSVRVLRLTRLAKISRLLKISDAFEKWEDSIPAVNPSFLRLMKLFIIMIFVAHLNACLWYYSGAALDEKVDGERVGRNWIDNYCISDARLDEPVCLSSLDPWPQYIASVYWAFTTMTTVGYGDIGPHLKSKGEIIVTILSQVVGTTVFAYVIGTLVTLVLNLDPGARQRKIQFEYLNNYMRDIHLSKIRRRQTRRHFNYRVRVKSVFQEDAILDLLPPPVRNPALIFLNRGMLPRLPWLCELEANHHGIIGVILPRLKPASFFRGDFINGPGLNAREMYFLVGGSVESKRRDGKAAPRRHDSKVWIDRVSQEISEKDLAKQNTDRPGFISSISTKAMVKAVVTVRKTPRSMSAPPTRTRKSTLWRSYMTENKEGEFQRIRKYAEGSYFCQIAALLPEDALFDLRCKYVASSEVCHILVLTRQDLQSVKLTYRDVYVTIEKIMKPETTAEALEVIDMDANEYEEAMHGEEGIDEETPSPIGVPKRTPAGPTAGKKKKKKRGLKGR